MTHIRSMRNSIMAATEANRFLFCKTCKKTVKYRKGYKVGAGLLAGGASLMVFGLGTSIVGIAELSDAIWGIGAASAVTGTLCFLSGIPTICVYKARLNRLEKRYNTSLQIGTSSNGLSMAISF